MSKKVLVIMGGFSAEKEVSITSGKGIETALKKLGYEVISHILVDSNKLIEIIKKEKPDVVFNALHGNWGEDGEIQGLLDMLQIPYTHSGLKASAIGMDKNITKLVCNSIGIKVPEGEKMTFAEFCQFGTSVDYPYVIKPVSDGSSVGVYIIRSATDLEKVDFSDINTEILIEKYIEGQELTVAVLQGKALTVTEMCPKKGFYDYHAKYTDGATMHIIPAKIPQNVFDNAKQLAEKLHKELGCKTVSRSDFRYNKKDGLVLLEINTAPGMTPLSLVPEQYAHTGGTYEKLCQILVEEASCRKIS